jgi:hypothetical protein
LRLNRDGLVSLRRGRRRMRTTLRKELARLLRVLETARRRRHEPSAEIMNRLGLIRERLRTRPILNLLPEWWNE